MDLKKYIKQGKLSVIVKPNTKKSEVLGLSEGKVRIAIAAVPDKDKANKELIRFLNKEYKLRVKIIRGLKSREKVLEIIS